MDITTRPDLLPLLSQPTTPDLNLAKSAGSPQEARQAAEKFEAFFLRTVLEDMIPDPQKDAFGGGGNAEKIWSSMLHEHYAELLAQRGGVGIADIVYRQLLTLQEATTTETTETGGATSCESCSSEQEKAAEEARKAASDRETAHHQRHLQEKAP